MNILEIAELYGEPDGIKEESIYSNGLEFAGREIEVVETLRPQMDWKLFSIVNLLSAYGRGFTANTSY
ncbi:MAG TPA: hypothetical protein ENL40_06620 [Thermococcus litoralis]|uniref:Uncharacterized protein n=1 Tax=Thermococcus litoralis TaxID=2265 RepID=A0A7C5JXA3_THELI|nr:hypothetical protein [Thermococcus litoralis]